MIFAEDPLGEIEVVAAPVGHAAAWVVDVGEKAFRMDPNNKRVLEFMDRCKN